MYSNGEFKGDIIEFEIVIFREKYIEGFMINSRCLEYSCGIYKVAERLFN